MNYTVQYRECFRDASIWTIVLYLDANHSSKLNRFSCDDYLFVASILDNDSVNS